MSAWDTDLFDEFLGSGGEFSMGRPVLWERARICSCRNLRSGSPAPGCDFCFGTGHCFDETEELHLGVSAYDVKRDWKAFGEVPSGTLVITIPVNANGNRLKIYDQIGDIDRITLKDATERRELILEKGRHDNHMQPLLEEVLGCRTSSASQSELKWVEGEHFVIDGLRVRWLTGPIDGTSYVLEVLTHPVFYVFNTRAMHRNHGVELPKRITMMPADLHDRNRRIGNGVGS